MIRPILAACLLSAPIANAVAQPVIDEAAETLREINEEVAIAAILADLHRAELPELAVVRDVRIVDPATGTVSEAQNVVIVDGRIHSIMPSGARLKSSPDRIIEGGGRFLSPGLVDMHIHSRTASSWLLNVAHGITTVREMGGFPWMLAARDAINADRLLGPTSYVAGTIINYYPLGGYAVVARDAPTARRIVRQQAACGYDFIKVHNVLTPSVFAAVAEESRRAGMDLVGHVPHATKVRDAAAAGMRTMEHLKGFIDDRTLELGDTDYAAAALDNVWITPTLISNPDFEPLTLRNAFLNSPAARYVPLRTRQQWRGIAATPVDEAMRLRRNSQILRRQITGKLVGNARLLAGSDGDGYPYQVMGDVLFHEFRILRETGLSAPEILRAATSSPATAMRAERDFGRIIPGARADFVLMTENPLSNPEAYRDHLGVMLRGRWLDRPALDRALAALATTYATATPQLSPDAIAQAEKAVGRGFVFNAATLARAAHLLRTQRRADDARRLELLAVEPQSGPCAMRAV